MKRFFCTICRKVKRVQKWPRVIQQRSSENPAERVGECNRHRQVVTQFRKVAR